MQHFAAQITKITFAFCLIISTYLGLAGCKKDPQTSTTYRTPPTPPLPPPLPPPPPPTGTYPLVINYQNMHDQWISVKADSVELTASSSSYVSVSSFRWRKVSGPGNPLIVDTTKLSTQVRNLQVGEYTFEVTAMNTVRSQTASVRIYVLNPMTTGLVFKNFDWLCPVGCGSQTINKIYSLVPSGKPLQVFIKYVDSPNWIPVEPMTPTSYDDNKIYWIIDTKSNFYLYANWPREGVKYDIKIEF